MSKGGKRQGTKYYAISRWGWIGGGACRVRARVKVATVEYHIWSQISIPQGLRSLYLVEGEDQGEPAAEPTLRKHYLTNPPTPPQLHPTLTVVYRLIRSPSPSPLHISFIFLCDVLFINFRFFCLRYHCSFPFVSCWGTGQGPRNKITPPRGMTKPRMSKGRRQGTKIYYAFLWVGWGEGHAGLVEEWKWQVVEYHIL